MKYKFYTFIIGYAVSCILSLTAMWLLGFNWKQGIAFCLLIASLQTQNEVTKVKDFKKWGAN